MLKKPQLFSLRFRPVKPRIQLYALASSLAGPGCFRALSEPDALIDTHVLGTPKRGMERGF